MTKNQMAASKNDTQKIKPENKRSGLAAIVLSAYF